MSRTLSHWQLTLTLLAAACSERSVGLDGADETGSSTTTDTSTDGEDESSDSETTGEPESCSVTWTAVLEPESADATGPYPFAIAPVFADETYVYGAVLRDLSSMLWIDPRDGSGASSGATEVEFGATGGTQLWSATTDDGGNLLAVGRFDPLDGGDLVASVIRYAPDGTELLRVHLDDPLEPEAGRVGIATSPAGAIVLSATVRVDTDDTDAWVARMDPETGAIEWFTTWSGPFEGGWSTDHGGPVAVDDDGRILALALVRHDYQTYEATLLAFDGVEPQPLWTVVPIDDPGDNHEQMSISVGFGTDGAVLTAIDVQTPSRRSSVISAFDAGAELWRLELAEIDGLADRDPSQARLIPEPEGQLSIVGTVFHDRVTPEAGVGAFFIRVDELGAPGCVLELGEPGDFRMPTAAASLGDLVLIAGPAPLGGPPPSLTGPGWMSAIAP